MLAVAIVACAASAAVGWALFLRSDRAPPAAPRPRSAGTPYREPAVETAADAAPWEHAGLLPLSSTRWKKLGAGVPEGGAVVPGLLRRIGESPGFAEAARRRLHEACLGGGELHEVAFATFPHLVAMTEAFDGGDQLRVLALAVGGATKRLRLTARRAPIDLLESADAAALRARAWSIERLPDELEELAEAVTGIAALHDPESAFAELADWLADDGFGLHVRCPTCGQTEILRVGDREAEVVALSPDGERVVRTSATLRDRPAETELVRRGAVALAGGTAQVGDADVGALVAAVADRHRAQLVSAIASVLAKIACPTCGHRFVIADGVRAARAR